MAAVKREVTSSGNLRFDAKRTEASHADIYWAKALADTAANTTVRAVSLGSDPIGNQLWDNRRQIEKPGGDDPRTSENPGDEFPTRSSIWDGDYRTSRFGP
jgi:hypothetical protein